MAVAICTKCPEPGELKALLQAALSGPDEARLIAHLDACEGCQKALELLAGNTAEVQQAARHLDQAKPAEISAYWRALQHIEKTLRPGDTPSESPLDRTAAYTPPNTGKLGACGPDEKKHLVAQAVAKHGGSGSAAEITENLSFLDPPEHPNTLGKLGRFHVVGLVGKGGMGMVLRALDVCLQRQVAIKVLSPEFLANDVARGRFLREARAAASIAHENVVAVHHVEQHNDSLPYLVMRLVKGESLQERLDRRNGPLDVLDIVQIGRQTAAGLAAAHVQGLIHRDIKPANILLEETSDKVLLTDFGLARAVEDSKLTQTGFVAGTPLYMSPEQARGESLDHRSDLFSLGSVLYAMATGKPPFEGTSPFVVLQAVTQGRQPSVLAVNPKIPDELAAVIEHLLAKNPSDRIQSAGEVAEILGRLETRLLSTHPLVGKPSAVLRLRGRTWLDRHAKSLLYGVVGALGMVTLSEATKTTRWTLLGQRGMKPAPQMVVMMPTAEPLLTIEGGAGPVWSAPFDATGETIAMGLDDGSVRLWSPRTGGSRGRIQAHSGPVWSVAYDADGKHLATSSDSGTVKVWDVITSKEFQELDHQTGVRALAFSPDGLSLATGTRNGAVTVWNVTDGTRRHVSAIGHSGAIMNIAFSPDGKTLATAGGDRKIKLWSIPATDRSDLKEIATLEGHTGGVYAIAFHPNGKTLASGSWDRTVRLWDVERGKQIGQLTGHSEDIWSVAFHPDGNHLVTGSEDRTTKVWDLATKQPIASYVGMGGGTIYSVHVSPDGKTIAAAGRDGSVRIWPFPK